MGLHASHPDHYTRDQKKEALRGMILEAAMEQKHPTRQAALIPGAPFEMRINQIDHRVFLTSVLQHTEALELLAEMVGAIDEGVR